MIGTIVNTAAIVVGSAIGSLAKRGLGEKYQNILFCAMGLAATGLGLHSVVEGMSESVYPVLSLRASPSEASWAQRSTSRDASTA